MSLALHVQTVLAILAIASYLALIAVYRNLLGRYPRIELGGGRRFERVSYQPRVGGREILRNMVLPGWGVSAAGDRWVGRFLVAAHVGFALARLVAFTDPSRWLFNLALALSFIVSMAALLGGHTSSGEPSALRYELIQAPDRSSS